MQDRAVGKLLDLYTDEVSQFAQQLDDVFTERFEKGKLVLSDLPIRSVLEIIERNALTNPSALHQLKELMSPPFYHFRDPATPEQVADLEKQLNVSLPADYKEFLAISNGFVAPFNGYIPEPTLQPTSDVGWADEDICKEAPLDLLEDGYLAWGPRAFDILVKAVEIGTADVDSTWLIPPSKVAEVKQAVRRILSEEDKECGEEERQKVAKAVQRFAGSEEEFWGLQWCCVSYIAFEMSAYPSFKAYLCKMAERGDDRREEDLLRGKRFWGYAFVRGSRREALGVSWMKLFKADAEKRRKL